MQPAMQSRLQNSLIAAHQQKAASTAQTYQALKAKGAVNQSLVLSQDAEDGSRKYVGLFVLGFIAGKVMKDDGFNLIPNVQLNVFG